MPQRRTTNQGAAATMNQPLEDLKESLTDAVRYLSGILEDITAGTYTPELAAADRDALEGSDSLGFMFALDYYANNPKGDTE
jgi:hypothetical protein